MASLEIGLVGVFALFAAILFGINVMVALGAVGALGLVSVVGVTATTTMLSTVFFETTHSFHFSVIPLFLLMGLFAMRAGLGEDLFDAANKWFGGLPGGLAISTTLGAAAFGAASGSSIGTATIFTKLALPQMLDRGYNKRMSAASIAIAGTLAVMIPPSAVMVIFGILTDSSIGALLIAGVIPGLVFAALLCLTTYFIVLRHPDYAPRSTETFTLREKLYSLRLAGPLVLVIGSIIFGLYFGVFTPTEAGGMGAAVTMLLAVIRQRGFKGLHLMETLHETVKTSAMIFAIIICALVFSRFLALSGVANTLGDFLTGLNVNRWVVVLIIVVHLSGVRHDDGCARFARHHAADHASGDDEARLRSDLVRRLCGAAGGNRRGDAAGRRQLLRGAGVLRRPRRTRRRVLRADPLCDRRLRHVAAALPVPATGAVFAADDALGRRCPKNLFYARH